MDIESENLNYAVKKDIYSESDIKSNEKIKKVKKENFDILKIKNERNYLNLFTFDFGISSNNLNDILLSEDKKIEEKTENNMDIESNPEIVRNKNKSKKNKNRKNKNKK